MAETVGKALGGAAPSGAAGALEDAPWFDNPPKRARSKAKSEVRLRKDRRIPIRECVLDPGYTVSPVVYPGLDPGYTTGLT